MFRPLLSSSLDLIFPPATLDGRERSLSGGLSAEAWSKVTFLEAPVCDGCGAPFEYDQGARCPACQARPRRFDRARSACLYDEYSRDLILQFKHADRTDLTPLFAAWVSRAAHDLLDEADLITPVPLHWSRLLRRRYNQSAEVARRLARMRRLSFAADLLVRQRRTEVQGGKSASGRRRNVAGAFTVKAGGGARLAGRKVLLIDDVLTTGATAEGCARALKLAGAAQVSLATIARVKETTNLTI